MVDIAKRQMDFLEGNIIMTDSIATVKYQYGAYSGTEEVGCDENDSDEDIIGRMWARFSRNGLLTLGMAYQSAKVVRRG